MVVDRAMRIANVVAEKNNFERLTLKDQMSSAQKKMTSWLHII